nr:hypothetical protein [Azohydromonas sediminis]
MPAAAPPQVPRRPLQPLDEGAHLHPHLVARELALQVRHLGEHATRVAWQPVTPAQRVAPRIELDELRQPRVLLPQPRQQSPARRPAQVPQVRRQRGLQRVERGLVVAVRVERLATRHQRALETRQPLAQVAHHAPAHQQVERPHDVAEEVHAVGHRPQALAPVVQFEQQLLGQEGADAAAPREQFVARARQRHEVVAVAQVPAALERVLDELVERVQVHVGEELAVQVADRQPLARRRAKERLVRRQPVHQPRVTLDERSVRAVVEHELRGQPARVVVAQLRVEHREQALLVDAHEVVADVQVQREGLARAVGGGLPHELLQPRHRLVHALAGAAGVRIVDEHRLPGALEVADQHVVDDAIAEVGREHLAQLRARDEETDRTGGLVRARDEFVAQRQQLQFLPRLEAQRVGGAALVAPARQVLPGEVLEREQGHGVSSSGANGNGVVLVALVVVVLVAVVGIEVPRVDRRRRRVRRTGPVVAGLH